MKLLLIVLLVICKKSSAADPTFTNKSCTVAEDMLHNLENCGPRSYAEGAFIEAWKEESDNLCEKAVRGLPNFTYSSARSFGRYRFKIHRMEEEPVAYNVLRCQGSPRPFFLKKSGRNHYDVYFQVRAIPPSVPLC